MIKIPFTEKYRPQTLDDVVGDSDMLIKFKEFIEHKSAPHLLFVGSPGIGKTTCAKILAKGITQEILFLNSSDKRGIDTLRNEIMTFCATLSWDDSGIKVVILDEVDNLTNDALQALRGVMEEYIETARFFLTGNNIGRIPEAIQSRCQKFDFNNISKNDVAKRCKYILDNEGIKYINFPRDIKYIINEYYPDIRQIVGSLSKFTVGNTFQVDPNKMLFAQHDTLIQFLKDKNWKSIRTTVCGSDTYDNLFKVLFDRAEEICKDKVEVIMILVAEGMKTQAIVADQEVNFMATILKIIQEI